MSDQPEIGYEFVDQHSRRRRVRFVREDPGGWSRVEEQLDDGEWRPLGGEAVADLEMSVDARATDVVEITPPDEEAPLQRGPEP